MLDVKLEAVNANFKDTSNQVLRKAAEIWLMFPT